jgi:hypothetical protein
MNKKGEAALTAVVTRLDEGSTEPLELTVESAAEGLSMQPLTVPSSSTRADIKLRANATAPGDFLLVGASQRNRDREISPDSRTERTMKLAALLFPTLCVGAQLSIFPPAIQLSGANATQTFIVSYTDDFGYEHDVTSECASSNNAKTSMKAVVVKCRGLQASAPIVVKIAARTPGISFVNDVSPIFTMSGCAGANCHGSIRGQRGFKLSLFGYEPKQGRPSGQ